MWTFGYFRTMRDEFLQYRSCTCVPGKCTKNTGKTLLCLQTCKRDSENYTGKVKTKLTQISYRNDFPLHVSQTPKWKKSLEILSFIWEKNIEPSFSPDVAKTKGVHWMSLTVILWNQAWEWVLLWSFSSGCGPLLSMLSLHLMCGILRVSLKYQ